MIAFEGNDNGFDRISYPVACKVTTDENYCSLNAHSYDKTAEDMNYGSQLEADGCVSVVSCDAFSSASTAAVAATTSVEDAEKLDISVTNTIDECADFTSL